MDEEIFFFNEKKTWVLVDKPPNKKTVACKWIYRINENLPINDNNRYKDRLVTKGLTQKLDINFFKRSFSYG